MDILNAFRHKDEDVVVKKRADSRGRKQLNVMVNPRLIQKMKKLAAEFAVARYAISEHALEIGVFYIEKVLKNPDRRKLIRDHLINQHVLDSGYDGGEKILRAGELRYSTELLRLASDVISCCRQARYALAQMKRSGNFDSMDEYKQKIYKSSLKLADWLTNHPLDEEQEKQVVDWYK